MLLNYGVGEDSLESSLDCKIKPVNLKGNQSWVVTGRTEAEAETPILWPPDAKNWLIGKDPDAGKDQRQEKKGMTEDEMVGWHQWLDGHEFEQASGVGDEQQSLACCNPWYCKELDTTEQLNWTGLNIICRNCPGSSQNIINMCWISEIQGKNLTKMGGERWHGKNSTLLKKIHIYMHICVNTNICMCVYIYIYTHTHIYISLGPLFCFTQS